MIRSEDGTHGREETAEQTQQKKSACAASCMSGHTVIDVADQNRYLSLSQ